MVDNFVIDEINIRQANREAMRRSIVEIKRKIDTSKNDANKEYYGLYCRNNIRHH